jgi:hypothetical protein
MRTRRLSAFGASLTIHVLAAGTVAWLARPVPRAAASAAVPRAVAVFVVAPAEDPLRPGLKPVEPSDDSRFQHGDESSALSLPGFMFDFAKIADNAPLLFPFLTPGLLFERFALTPQREVAERLRNPFAPAEARETNADRVKPPLVLGDAALQGLLDKTWSRRDRWGAFQPIVRLTETYDANSGKLPVVLHMYLDQNGLQPYIDTYTRDPRLWTELGMAADHVRFVGFISRYASTHPSTKTTTELLFLLDKLAQAGLDALVTLLNVNPMEDLQRTRMSNVDAFRLIGSLRSYYYVQLARKRLTTVEALPAYYANVRLSILEGILRTTPAGYRASDARFLMGEIYFRQGKLADARRVWREMTVDPTDSYAIAAAQLLEAIPASDAAPLDVLQIQRILNGQRARWVNVSIDRLHQFGYRFDTY